MKKNIFSILAICVLCFSFSINDWKNVYTGKGITISSKVADCNLERSYKQRWILLKVENTSNSKLKVEWDEQLSYNNEACSTCDNSAEHHKSIIIEANKTLEGSCSFSTQNELRIVSKLLDVETKTEITDFKLANIKITEIK